MKAGFGFSMFNHFNSFSNRKFFVTSITLLSKKKICIFKYHLFLESNELYCFLFFDLMQYVLLTFVFFYRSTVILLMLCNAVARGLILCWIPKPEHAEKKKEDADRSRKASEKNHERADIIQSFSVDPHGLPDIKAALEVQTPLLLCLSWSAVVYYNSYKLNHRNFCKENSSHRWQLPPPQVLLRCPLRFLTSCSSALELVFALQVGVRLGDACPVI